MPTLTISPTLKRVLFQPHEQYKNYIYIGGLEFYSENIVRGTDVICSVYNRTDLFLYRVFGSVFTYCGKPELITRHVEVSHNIVINAKQNIKPVSGVFNVNEISC